MKLNLGCGRHPFPLDPDNVPIPEHTLPIAQTAFEPGWLNVDKFQMPGVDEVVDLFRFPWVRSSNGCPWNDNSIDEIWCAHILEHVPHQVKMANMVPLGWKQEYERLTGEYDGFFVFFAELYRILKPGGLVHIRAPFGVSYPSLSDPTHTRYLTPGSLGYLEGQGHTAAPFDYHLPMRFELVDSVMFRFRGQYVHQMEWYTEKGMQDHVMLQPNAIDEFRAVLRAVKEA